MRIDNINITKSNVVINDNKSPEPLKKNYHNIQLFHIYGDADFGEYDSLALKRAGLQPKTLTIPDFTRLNREFALLRKADRLPDNFHFSGHSNTDYLSFNQTLVTDNEFLSLFVPTDSLNIIFLNSCESFLILDKFIERFNICVGLSNLINNIDAIKLTHLFWKTIKQKTIIQTEEIIRDELPKLYSNLRILYN